MVKKPNRIPVLLAACICTGMGGYLLTWSYFRDSLGQLFPTWTSSQLSLPFSLHNITVCVMMLTTGQILHKLSNRVVICIGGFALMIGFGLFPLLPLGSPGAALVMVTISFGFIAALSVGIGIIASFDTFLPWFPDRTGMVSGILTFFSGVAPMMIGALCGVFIRNFGVLRAVQLTGVVLAALIFIALIWAKQPGPDVVLPAPPPADAKIFTDVDYTPAEMLKTGTFWCMFAFNVLLRTTGIIVFDLGGTIAVAFGAATIVGLMFAPLNGAACILGGIILDRLGTHKVMLIFSVSAALGAGALFIGNQAGAAALVIAGIALIGFAYGGVTVTCVSGNRMLFGMKHYAKNLGLISVSIGPAAVAAMIAGRLIRERNSFTGVFTLIMVLTVASVASCCLMFATERKRRS